MITSNVVEPDLLVKSDDVPWEVSEYVYAGVTRRYIHAMHGGHPPGHGQAKYLPHNEFVMHHEFFVTPAVGKVMLR
jgi:hypothetical protein